MVIDTAADDDGEEEDGIPSDLVCMDVVFW